MSKGESPVSVCRDLYFLHNICCMKRKKVWVTFQRLQVLGVFWFLVDCNRMPEQVDHSLNPTGSHCYFKRADICWRAERGPFQRNDESPVLDCSERGPHERMRRWQEGWKGERKRFQTTIRSFSPPCFTLLTLYLNSLFCAWLLFFLYIYLCRLNSFYFNRIVD